MVKPGDPLPPCPLCASHVRNTDKRDYLIEQKGWTLFQCSRCRTAFIHPVPGPDVLGTYYDDTYYGKGEGKFLSPVEIIVRVFRMLRAKSIKKHMPAGRVLDVGCGRGVMLSFLKNWGYHVDGVELDTVAAKRARYNTGQPIFHSLHDVIRAAGKPYDIICFFHSLEHMSAPGDTLKTAHKLLIEGGILIIAAPHAASIQSRLAGPNWLHLDLPRHLVQFDMNQLASSLVENGFALLRHDHFSQEYNVIDTLCHLYRLMGFDPLYPFNIIRNIRRDKPSTWSQAWATILGLTLLTPLTAMAFLLSNLFSAVRSGSTTTLYLRKVSALA